MCGICILYRLPPSPSGQESPQPVEAPPSARRRRSARGTLVAVGADDHVIHAASHKSAISSIVSSVSEMLIAIPKPLAGFFASQDFANALMFSSGGISATGDRRTWMPSGPESGNCRSDVSPPCEVFLRQPSLFVPLLPEKGGCFRGVCGPCGILARICLSAFDMVIPNEKGNPASIRIPSKYCDGVEGGLEPPQRVIISTERPTTSQRWRIRNSSLRSLLYFTTLISPK